MKKYLFLVLFYFLSISELFSSEKIYESDFYTVDIKNNNITDSKIKEIEKVKIISYNKIINRILTNKNFIKFKNINIINNEIDYLIKNILIEDEFISSNIYSAKIKVNFNSKLIISMLRDNKISYTDLNSPNILLIISEKNDLYQKGLSPDNSFYKKMKSNKFGLLNLIYPKLSPNDQFILPYSKIISYDQEAFQKIGNKYDADIVFIINLHNQNKLNNIELIFFDNKNNYFENLSQINTFKDGNLEDYILNFINDWWKEYSIIDNSVINQYSCFVKNSNIKELHYIYSKIDILSQVKSISLSKIILGSNLYDISFYGNLSNLSMKLNINKIRIAINSNDECNISIIN